MSITNYFGVSWYAFSRIPRNQYNLQHSWSWVAGRHQLDFGLDITREQSLIDQDFQSDGNFGFGGDIPGTICGFLIGKPSAFNQITPLYVNLLRNLYGLYLQDDFKVIAG